MIEYEIKKEKDKCYGCRACEQICPKLAIVMKEDEEGFFYPEVNKEKCINCNLCSKVCPYSNELYKTKIRKVYAVQYKNEKNLMESSSGGAFSLFADYILSIGGYISGCIFDENLIPRHVVSNKKEIISKMRGSKYVQSDIRSTYKEIKDLLNSKKIVLFTGTPCQVDGLKRYLMKEYDNLFTLDLICHGVPSFKILEEYLNSEKNKGKKIEKIKFRDKKLNGWCSQGSIKFNKKIKNISPFNNSYYYYYLKNCINRYSCYTCKYSSINRVGDITIGDYWNLNNLLPKLDTSKGYSVILISSPKGEKLFESVKDKSFYYETELKFVAENNGNLIKPTEFPKLRERIYKDIEIFGYEYVEKKECHYQYVFPFIRKCLPKKIKFILKKLKRG